MRVIAVANQKGGVGKTSAVVNLGAALAERGRRVLVVDLDPQANATQWLAAEAAVGVREALLEGRPLAELIVRSEVAGVDVVPARRELAAAERDLMTRIDGDRVLGERIAELDDTRWDFVLFDCPPQLGMLTLSGLFAADEMLVPVEASTVALAGLADLMDTLSTIRARVNPNLALAGIFVSRVDIRTQLGRAILEELATRYPEHAMKTYVRDRTRMREAWSYQQPILTYDPSGDAAEDYRALAAEIDQLEAQRAAS